MPILLIKHTHEENIIETEELYLHHIISALVVEISD